MKGWVGPVGWPIADGLPTWSPVSYRSSVGQEKFADSTTVQRSHLTMTLTVRLETCSCERMFWCVGLVIVRYQWSGYCLNVTACVCMMQDYGTVIERVVFRNCDRVITGAWKCFWYNHSYSLTQTLLELNLPSFDTVLVNSRFRQRRKNCGNLIVKQLATLSL